jgi:hypothetical protein
MPLNPVMRRRPRTLLAKGDDINTAEVRSQRTSGSRTAPRLSKRLGRGGASTNPINLEWWRVGNPAWTRLVSNEPGVRVV